MKDIADHCFVSKSTVNRFCRDNGYEDFFELATDVYRLADEEITLVGKMSDY